MSEDTLALIELEKKRRLDTIDKEMQRRTDSTHVANNLARVSEPTEDDTNIALKGLEFMQKYSNELKVGAYRGITKGVTSTAKFVTDLFGQSEVTESIDDTQKYFDKLLETKTGVGEVGELLGQVGIGAVATRRIGDAGLKGRMLQGAIIDGIVFDENSDNMFNLLEEVGVSNAVTEWLKNDDADGNFEARAKNAIAGGIVGSAVEGVFGMFKYGKKLLQADGIKLDELDDKKIVSEVIKKVKQDADNIKQVADDAEPPIVRDDEFAITEDINKKAQDLLNNVRVQQLDNLNIKPEMVGVEDTDTFLKAVDDAQPELAYRSRKETLKLVDEQLRKDLDDPAFDIAQSFENTVKKVRDLDVEFNKQKVIIGTLANELSRSKKIVEKEGSASSVMQFIVNLERLNSASQAFVDAKSLTGRAFSSLNADPKMSELFNSLKVLDSYDPDYSIIQLKKALKDNNQEDVLKIIDDITDPLKNVKDVVEKTTDSTFTKVGNILSEYGVAQMLSAPSTMAVNFVGNTIIKKLRFIQDSAQFVIGQTLRSPDRMKLRAYRQLAKAEFLQTAYDIKAVAKLSRDWAKSGFKDEVVDEGVLARFIQDQEYHHKYFSAKYIRGLEEGSRATLTNTTIDMMGRVFRSPYRAIGLIDDYYKRNNFRIELSRIADEIAETRNISDKDYVGFVERFNKANTELLMTMNNLKRGESLSKKLGAEWLKANKQFIGKGKNINRYAEQARDYANEMTFQKELGNGLVGKTVDLLNSNGYARILVPFKLTPINLLKMSGSIALRPLQKQLYKDIAQGGLKRDIALAKLTISITMLSGIAYLAQSGLITGSFSKEERATMQSAGIPEYSMQVGDKWLEYKQLEPFATIAGIMTDWYKVYSNMSKYTEVNKDDLDTSMMSMMADLGLAVSNNILNKTYLKSLAEVTELATGGQNLVDYSGNTLAGLLPFSSAVSFGERVLSDEYKKEAKTFQERLLSRYRFALDREALDSYGRPIDNVKYNPILLKEFKIDTDKNLGALEVARLGINLSKMPETVTYEGLSVKLEPEEYWTMRRSLDTRFKLTDRLNTLVSTDSYKDATDFVKENMLRDVIATVRQGAITTAFKNTRVRRNLTESAERKLEEINKTKRRDYNTMIIERIEGE